METGNLQWDCCRQERGRGASSDSQTCPRTAHPPPESEHRHCHGRGTGKPRGTSARPGPGSCLGLLTYTPHHWSTDGHNMLGLRCGEPQECSCWDTPPPDPPPRSPPALTPGKRLYSCMREALHGLS